MGQARGLKIFMKKAMRHTIYIVWLALLAASAQAQNGISGKVFDTEYHPLVGATVSLFPDSVLAVTDGEGFFRFDISKPGDYSLLVQYIGYESLRREVLCRQGRPVYVEIALQSGQILLETVEVHEEHAKLESSAASAHLSGEEILSQGQGTLAQSLAQVPGIRAINLGVGISKPVIRGLSNNRIQVRQLGIKQEGHQWGADHGLEIDPFSAERVEIIKGAASLQYGSDALGGVINVQPARIPRSGHIEGEVRSQYKSNNDHFAYSGKVAFHVKNLFGNVRISRQRFSDFTVPAESFEYNGFTLPLRDGKLVNTAGEENNALAEIGLQADWGITRLSYSDYALRAGLFPGAVGVPRAYRLEPDGAPRDIDVPAQDVRHRKLALNQTLFIGNDHLAWQLGWQENRRIERSMPEFHQIPAAQIDPGDNRAVQLSLRTLSGDIHFEKHRSHLHKHVTGINWQHQSNRRGGFAFLLPDFHTQTAGLYHIRENRPTEHLMLNGGLRLDWARNETQPYTQYIYTSQGERTDSLTAPTLRRDYFNFSASAGAAAELGERWELKANLSKSFRVPYPSELVSNGIHHGTFRHEQGDPRLRSEHGYQLEGGIRGGGGRWQLEVNAYFHYFDNFIYLAPSARFSALPEAGLLWTYRQDDAIFTGAEALLSTSHWRDQLQLEVGGEYLYNRNLVSALPLPFTPPARAWLHKTLQFRLSPALPEIRWTTRIEGTAPQNRVDRNEKPTPGYLLVNTGIGGKLKWGKQSLQWQIQALNLFDTSYLNHLSRYRLLNLPEQGRNFVFSLHVPFDIHLH